MNSDENFVIKNLIFFWEKIVLKISNDNRKACLNHVNKNLNVNRYIKLHCICGQFRLE